MRCFYIYRFPCLFSHACTRGFDVPIRQSLSKHIRCLIKLARHSSRYPDGQVRTTAGSTWGANCLSGKQKTIGQSGLVHIYLALISSYIPLRVQRTDGHTVKSALTAHWTLLPIPFLSHGDSPCSHVSASP